MINLLPPDTKKQLKAAHMNIVLIRYIVLLGISIIFLIGLVSAAYVVLNASQAVQERVIQSNKAKAGSYSDVQAELSTLQTSLSTTKNILATSISYSSVMTAIAQLLPKGVIIDSLSLTASTFGTPTTLQAHAKDNASALQLKQSFQSSPLFSNVSFQSLSSSTTPNATTNSAYPIAIVLSLTINKVTTP